VQAALKTQFQRSKTTKPQGDPMSKQHTYRATVEWTGNLGSGTSSYTAYSRDYTVRIAGKPDLLGSSDPAFRGDEHRHKMPRLLRHLRRDR